MDIVRPKYERSEKQRLASLDPKEKIKEEGDWYIIYIYMYKLSMNEYLHLIIYIYISNCMF